VHGLEAEYWGQIDFVYLDRVDPANSDVVERYGISYQPVFILIAADGAEVQRWAYAEAEDFRTIFDTYLEATSN
jgi:hypothetical protein